MLQANTRSPTNSRTATFGDGCQFAFFKVALNLNPNIFAVDVGAADFGPYFLGVSVYFTDRTDVNRNFHFR